MKRVALVAQELHPFSGGGIAPIVAATARLLSTVAEVTLVTSSDHRERYERMRRAGDPGLVPGARYVFVEEPEPGHPQWLSRMHAYSAAVFEVLCREFPDGGPELIEFCDYLGEGFVTVQARHTRDPRLRNSLVCVRLHTTVEMCAVLDGNLPDDFASAATHDAERYALRHADRILWSGGDVLGTYRRFYGADALAPAERIPDAFLTGPAGAGRAAPEPPPLVEDGPLRLLYLGRMERRKGVQNLLRAVAALDPGLDWRLTLLGGDTETAPLKQSVRAQLELMAAGDDRIEFSPGVERHEVGAVIRRHDAVVTPSLWECWPNVVREALEQNRPVLATPVGGMLEMVRPGVSGWLAEDTSVDALTHALEALLREPGAARRLTLAGGPAAVFAELTEPARLVASYESLLEARSARALPTRTETPLVSVIVPYFRLSEYVEATLASIAAQTYPRIEVLLVNDGSALGADEVIVELAERYGARLLTQANAGLGQARNLGVRLARGRYVLPVDADDTIAPTLVARLVDVLESEPELAYATPWARFTDEDGRPMRDGHRSYGNWSGLVERNNVAGTCTALLRRDLILAHPYSPDMTSYEDWMLYRRLRAVGQVGAVVPEYLLDYRTRADSMMREAGLPRTGVLYDEMRAHLVEASVAWVGPA